MKHLLPVPPFRTHVGKVVEHDESRAIRLTRNERACLVGLLRAYRLLMLWEIKQGRRRQPWRATDRVIDMNALQTRLDFRWSASSATTAATSTSAKTPTSLTRRTWTRRRCGCVPRPTARRPTTRPRSSTSWSTRSRGRPWGSHFRTCRYAGIYWWLPITAVKNVSILIVITGVSYVSRNVVSWFLKSALIF